jgi:HlyD family secretion protein
MTDEHRGDDQPKPPRRRVFIVVGAVLIGLLALGAYGHWQTNASASQTQQQAESFVPTVRTAVVKSSDAPTAVTLPGQTQAFTVASISARATGYIAELRVDIGSRVKKGDLLVQIAAPDLDAQLAQAQAQLAQYNAAILQSQAQLKSAEASTKLANVTNQRTGTLAQQGWETKQNADNSSSNLATSTAAAAAAQAGIAVAVANSRQQQATVDRLTSLTSFERVVAPFDGVVTTRNVDTGDLVTADPTGGTALFSMAQDDVLRVAINVPQSSAVGVVPGLQAHVTVPEIPGRSFAGKVARSSVALLATSRTLTTEVDVPNGEGALRAGMFVNVSFDVPRQHPALMVPDEALIFNQAGMQLAVVQPDNTIKLSKVTIGRDFGTTVELAGGMSGGERVVLSAPANLADGAKVKPAQENGTP